MAHLGQSLGDAAKDLRLVELLEKELRLKRTKFEENQNDVDTQNEVIKKLGELVTKCNLLGQEYCKKDPADHSTARRLYQTAEGLCGDGSQFRPYFANETTRLRQLSCTYQNMGTLEKQSNQLKAAVAFHQKAIEIEMVLAEMKKKGLNAPPAPRAAETQKVAMPWDTQAEKPQLTEESESKALLVACKKGDSDAALQTIQRGIAVVDVADAGKNTALHHACQNRMVLVVQELCKAGVYVNCSNEAGNTPLHFTASSSLELTKVLLNTGVDIFVADKSGNTALHYACLANLPDIALLLIDRGADFMARNKTGNTPLHYAVSSSMSSVVETLLGRGADINSRDNSDNTPLHYACSLLLPSMAMILIHHKPDLNITNKAGNTAVLYACSNSMADIAMLLIKKGAEVVCIDAQKNTPLHYACANQMESVVQELVRHKEVNIDAQNEQGNTALHYACSANNLPIVRMLVQMHASLSVQDVTLNTPLHYAMLTDRPEVAEYLITEGASVHIKNNEGRTPLDYAVVQ